jgi:ASC-1-like (ASCH) protein
LARGMVLRARPGDTLVLGGFYTYVTDIEHYASFGDMLEHVGLEKALPGVATVEEGVELYLRFRGYGEGEAACGVHAIHFELWE